MAINAFKLYLRTYRSHIKEQAGGGKRKKGSDYEQSMLHACIKTSQGNPPSTQLLGTNKKKSVFIISVLTTRNKNHNLFIIKVEKIVKLSTPRKSLKKLMPDPKL